MNCRHASILAFALLGCGTTDSDTDTDTPVGEPHFAYLEAANPAVVVAGTTRGGEGLVILSPLGNGGIGQNGIGGIAYRSVNGSTLTIRLGSDGLPASAHGNGFIVLFQNYRDGFVDLAYLAQDGRTAIVRNVAMPSNLQVPNAVAASIGTTTSADLLLSTRIRWASASLSAVACAIDLHIGAASLVVGGVAIPGAVVACASAAFKLIALLPGQEWASVASASLGGMSCAAGAVAGCVNFFLSQAVSDIANTVAAEEARRAEIAVARGNLGPGAGGVPSVPALLLATAVSSSRIDLTWGDVSGETDYDLERCIGSNCTDFSALITLAAGTTSYQNSSLAGGTTYRYRLKARNGSGSSGYAGPVEATTTSVVTWCGSSADFNGGILPAAYQSLRWPSSRISSGLFNNRVEFRPQDSGFEFGTFGSPAAGTGTIRATFDGTLANTGFGHYFNLQLTTSSGPTWMIGTAIGSFGNQTPRTWAGRYASGTPSGLGGPSGLFTSIADETFTAGFDTYRFEFSFANGSGRWRIWTLPGLASVLDRTTPLPGFATSAVNGFFMDGYMTSGGTGLAWMDNFSITCSP